MTKRINPVTVLAQDTFDRADQSGLGTASDGKTWTLAGGGTWAISSNQATMSAPSDGALATVDAAATNMIVSVTAPTMTWSASSNEGLSLVARYADASNYYMVIAYAASSGIQVYKRVAGSNTLIANTATLLTAGQTLALSVVGTTVRVLVNGSQLLSVTDSALSSGTRAGLRNQGGVATGKFWENFLVTAP